MAPDRVSNLVDEDDILRTSVLDIQLDNDTLVVLANADVPRAFIRSAIKSVWEGPLEVFCATGLMVGSCESVE